MDTNKHKFMMMQILKDIFTDPLLSSCMAFKGGTSLMFFYQLPRFSVDLDFNLLDCTKQHSVFEKLKTIAQRYGQIKDSQEKFFGPIVVLDYGKGENNLKLEVSNREYGNHYEIKNLMGINIRVMQKPDMFAHKLCALLDRKGMTGRDVYDCHFFLNIKTPINKDIVEYRMGMPLKDYTLKCVDAIQKFSTKAIMSNIGELIDSKEKTFIKTRLKDDTISLLRFSSEYPLIQEYQDSNMIVNQVTINPVNDDVLEIKATIDDKEYTAKQISASDKQLYCSLISEQEKTGLAKILAKKYFINEWNKANNK
jgi:predicted nucleotidyltransferase component of viral defense system